MLLHFSSTKTVALHLAKTALRASFFSSEEFTFEHDTTTLNTEWSKVILIPGSESSHATPGTQMKSNEVDFIHKML